MSGFDAIRESVLLHSQKMAAEGLVVASAGNVSARVGKRGGLVAITPTSIPYPEMAAAQIVIVELATGQVVDGTELPSGELPMHLAVYRAKPDVGAVVHTHAPFVTSLSILRRPLPPVIDEMALYFGGTVEVAEYSFTGTDQLGANVVAALGDRAAVILANHGNVCVGRDLTQALHVAVTMESCARAYLQALTVGEPLRLPDDAVEKGRAMYVAKR